MNHTNIGGQAVIEGVMMRDKNRYSIAVRLPDQSIETFIKEIKPWKKIFDKPFFRGIKALVQNLKIGYHSLQWSAEKQEQETKKQSPFWDVFTIIFSIAVAIGLFIVLPNLAIHFIGIVEKDQPLVFNLASGFVRLMIFTLYVLGISLIKEVRKIFQYHGAEHKVIHAFEEGLELKFENIKPFPTLHKRCGTSFIFLLIFIGILAFSVVPPILGLIFTNFHSWILVTRKIVIFLSHIIILPLLASVSYELLKLSAKNNWISKILGFLAYPGLFFQKITTKEPDEKQTEVAVASLNVLLENKEN